MSTAFCFKVSLTKSVYSASFLLMLQFRVRQMLDLTVLSWINKIRSTLRKKILREVIINFMKFCAKPWFHVRYESQRWLPLVFPPLRFAIAEWFIWEARLFSTVPLRLYKVFYSCTRTATEIKVSDYWSHWYNYRATGAYHSFFINFINFLNNFTNFFININKNW